MRINRLKRLQKNLSFYVNNFGLKKPFHVLLDGTVCFVALKDKLDVQQQIKTYLGDDVKMFTTPCVVIETEKLGKSVFGAMLIVKKFPIRYCEHKDNPVSGSECLLSMVGSSTSNRYIIATQDRDLQDKLRLIPGVPLFYFFNKGPTLEAPSKVSEKAAAATANARWGINQYEQEALSKLKEVEGLKSEDIPAKKKKKKTKNPNPLSCKRKKKKTEAGADTPKKSDAGVKKKRNRRGKKLPQHVKEELLRIKSATQNSV
ncbi:rRNA-processing protein UTP23 homolog [Thrips palmi]|uniref:rRNA-processing protein UTP23 homolog n=1 Tax=Thrips palmi TaxID=161013 RepID=A0A6P8ZKF6_THRPL|nr:rRNA-processing protein UTP23 homolog [Thrips palmi]